MRRVLLLVLLACCIPAAAPAQSRAMTPAAAEYLELALDTIEAVTLGHDTIPWRVVRDSAFRLAEGATVPRDTYGAIAWALHRVNPHSFLQAAHPGAGGWLLDGRVGYLRVPEVSGAGVEVADTLQRKIGELQDSGACGWIVDLRANGGGNMWPMLAGVGPLLADSIVGQFGFAGDGGRWFYRAGISGILHRNGTLDTAGRSTVTPVTLRQPAGPVAVLIDGGTGSSGEATAIAFRGRPNTRSFGAPSAGYTSSNRGSRLPDGANMVVTTGYDADRLGHSYGERLEPDVTILGSAPEWPFPTDRTAHAATVWLEAQPACRGSAP